MAIDPQRLLALDIPQVEHSYTAKDTILYALGVGLGQHHDDERELTYVYEKHLRALPTMICVLGHMPLWIRDLDIGIDWRNIVHGEQKFTLHRALAPSGTVTGKMRIVDVIDKGAGKGALLVIERIVTDTATGERIATLLHTGFCRGEGGFATKRPSPPPHALPDRAPDFVCDLPTRPETALVYRLSGDLNALHVDPEHARALGFEGPILHGLATFGVAGHAILKTICDYDPTQISGMQGRFSAPVYPGETIRSEIWRDGGIVSYRARVLERDVVAISNGRVDLKQ